MQDDFSLGNVISTLTWPQSRVATDFLGGPVGEAEITVYRITVGEEDHEFVHLADFEVIERYCGRLESALEIARRNVPPLYQSMIDKTLAGEYGDGKG